MNPEQKIKGRPPKLAAGAVRKMYYDSDLHALLAAKLPEFVQGGRISVPALADGMGYSAYHIYRTLQDNRLSTRALNKLVEIANQEGVPGEDRLSKDDLLQFLLN